MVFSPEAGDHSAYLMDAALQIQSLRGHLRRAFEGFEVIHGQTTGQKTDGRIVVGPHLCEDWNQRRFSEDRESPRSALEYGLCHFRND